MIKKIRWVKFKNCKSLKDIFVNFPKKIPRDKFTSNNNHKHLRRINAKAHRTPCVKGLYQAI